MSNSYIENINYIANLDNSYATGATLSKSNMVLLDNTYQVVTTIKYYDMVSFTTKTITNTQNGVTGITLTSSMLAMQSSIESMGMFSVTASSLATGLMNLTSIEVDLSIANGSQDILIRAMNIQFINGDTVQYSIDAVLSNTKQYIPALTSINVSSLNDNLPIVSDNILSVNTVATNVTTVNAVASNMLNIEHVANNIDSVLVGLSTIQASVSDAAASATTATSQATIATNATSQASALLASFRSVFLGSFASDTQAITFANTNSISIVDGIMYENSVEDKFRVYNGTTWIDYDSSAQTAQSVASLSASNASASATTAEIKASDASASALSALGYANDALASATLSSDKASIATTNASDALVSSQSASTSATNAANSAAKITGMTVATGIPGTTALWDSTNGILTIPKGDKGDTGAQGAQGIQGIQGAIGFTGAQGIQGVTGDTGAQGIQGITGLTGLTGTNGIDGINGINGIDGKTITNVSASKLGKVTTLTVDGTFPNSPVSFTLLDGLDGSGTGDMISTNNLSELTNVADARTKLDVYSKSEVNALTPSETDPVFTASQAHNITATDITNLSHLSGINTGDQDLSGLATDSALMLHTGNTSNPHIVTKTQVGLGNVANADTTTTANITDYIDKRFVTDAELSVLSATSGLNTGDQTITLTGDVTGTGNGSFSATLASVGTAGTYSKVTTDVKGRVTSGSNPTTISEFGITDAMTATAIASADAAVLSTAEAFTTTAITNLINNAPATLDTLAELAAQMQADESGVASLSTIVGTKATDSLVVHLAGAETISGVKTFLDQPVGIVKDSVGLANVDNTSDINKPISNLTLTALGLLTPQTVSSLNGIHTIRKDNSWIYNQNGSVTGAIQIKLVGLYTQTFSGSMNIRITQNDVVDGAFIDYELNLGGYWKSSDSLWHNTKATMVSSTGDSTLNVRFAHNGVDVFITIGDISSVWSYPNVAILEAMVGATGYIPSFEFSTVSSYPATIVSTVAIISKQDALVSGTNIKTVGGVSVIGSGDIALGAKPTTAFLMAYSI